MDRTDGTFDEVGWLRDCLTAQREGYGNLLADYNVVKGQRDKLQAECDALGASLADAASGLARAGEQIEALTAEANRERVERQALEARLRLLEPEPRVIPVRVSVDPRSERVVLQRRGVPVGTTPAVTANHVARARAVLLDIAEGKEPHAAPAVRVAAAKALLGVS
jgi:hypothetical protein